MVSRILCKWDHTLCPLFLFSFLILLPAVSVIVLRFGHVVACNKSGVFCSPRVDHCLSHCNLSKTQASDCVPYASMTPASHHSLSSRVPPHSLCASQTLFFLHSGTCPACACPRAFALAASSSWNTLSVYGSSTSFRCQLMRLLLEACLDHRTSPPTSVALPLPCLTYFGALAT